MNERVACWTRIGRVLRATFCLGCKRFIAKGEAAWRASNGTDTGRRLCPECMDKRQRARGRK